MLFERDQNGVEASGGEGKGVVRVDKVVFGGPQVVLIAGPCTVESRNQLLDIAGAVKEAGAVMLRGGAFKPRTSPYTFQGLCAKGLEYLAEARAMTGLPFVTEVLETAHLHDVAQVADMVQLGSRNMHNSVLLRAAGSCGKPVLLKRGMSARIEEYLLAAEYVLQGGARHVVLCERGIRTFETMTRFSLDLNAVPLLKERTWLPVIVDPSHGTSVSRLVTPMARAAVACGADGLIVEVHNRPEQALCDGKQSITLEAFAAMVKGVRDVAEAVGRTL
ncbi:MAG TPA: 3-deoxy-7-phosphoheptulonate synthase [Kiritimatiellia bacterium]|jgi:3-deoxy-7-phosphoheptulonate synthase|nr:3-deoxy-7-phosphoheptulonate synthase [Kiritimatiellia bacterium]HOM58945.1 3-deoxy-7-phosphoheptulonate synthase [Kiritimatiellia bacterium]HPK36926.1 3-deoxy-7-phosphoheptulonate synthase [Kiritimatiellia bacterium]HPW75423.1 3-deoxy-7-phosphoheptulonate synthase [Kiritimatiellia bacterium]